MKCTRCGEPMVMYLVDDRYCLQCKREIRVREQQDAKRREQLARYSFAKPLGAA